jgi:trigger factor
VEAHLTVKVQEVDPSGLPLIGRKVAEETVELGFDQLGIGSDEQLIGLKAGERRVIKVRPLPGDLAHAPMQTAIISPNQAAKHRSDSDLIHLAVEVQQVEVAILPELNDEFARLVGENFKSLDALREILKFRLMTYVESVKRRQLERSIIRKLIEENPFYVSRKIVDETLNEVADSANYQGDKRREFLENYRQNAEADYRWVKLRDEIAQQENIKITDDILNSEIERYAVQHGKMVDQARKEFEKEGLEGIRARMLEHEVLEFLITNAVIEKRNMSLTEFLRATTSPG